MPSPFRSPDTPEARNLGRNDSKNPSTTCKGLTSSGRPCRRALAAGGSSSPSRRQSGVAAFQSNGQLDDADLFCWQHKSQSQQGAPKNPQVPNGKLAEKQTEGYGPTQRTSIDTLVQRLGIDDVPDDARRKTKTKKEPKPPKRTETRDFAGASPHPQRPQGAPNDLEKPSQRPRKKTGFWDSLCCVSNGGDDDYVEVVRHRKRTGQVPSYHTATNPPPSSTRPPSTRPPRRPSGPSAPPRRPDATEMPGKPVTQKHASSNTQTEDLLRLLPPHLAPQTTSTLLAELVKPISPTDEEGYIYIFWLTPQSKQSPDQSAARSLLSPGKSRPKHERRVSDVMTEFSFDGSERETRGKKTIMLKIGRANNVARRMNEWQRQCGYALNLVRWYPYVPSSTTPSPQPSPSRPPPESSQPSGSRRESGVVKKVTFVKRVERLIHLELHEQQVKRQCDTCGKEHREWFEVEATEAGVRAVDDCVKRWVSWAERENVKR
ncbi:hypothetical protein KC352_g13775 [Hortaea werneckii]|uniref:Bacteriophage T5 Orf172 DNA-binding domain-containing protein n=1 Tax=Hortaea werneckii EXF-2000 TaxID=1157616 RepID=A0A1Z5TNF5_HORWE|nr:hypothetical protein KC358_g531 [Hortaea werneckii]OTA37518.1 hypothetical protein BTJ68_02783 [Hortaea werneckii EXF-2000]KAI6922187.1 hypothetical protein KC341_g15519 [Hortaea werneckii]KAI6946088.1 hypothetical protein KC348_g3378 [Hortaea werneckii]KAI6981913.1 hypothetical protein KC321_g960 [Hortaea werneckii]